MLHQGDEIELTVDKPASGGRMIARHQGQVVLVRGAIPGERVTASIERAEKQLAYAVVREVLEPSPARRRWDGDALCGGALYGHITYDRQLTIKSDVIRDAFARVGRHPIDAPIDVAGSPEEGYRMRARFHVHGTEAGFYREGTHELCDAASTRQLRSETIDLVRTLTERFSREAPGAVSAVTITENIAADQRAVHLELRSDARVPPAVLERALSAAGVNGISARSASASSRSTVGTPWVTDPLAAVTGGRAASGELRRHAEAFFQGNRFLLPALVAAVAGEIAEDDEVLDLYAGVGLFSVALAAMRPLDIIAVEGDRTSGADLVHNAQPHAARLHAVVSNVEEYLMRRSPQRASAMIVDPPRTGLSKEAVAGIIRYGARRVVYVSCDPPTLARDARRMLDGGYTLTSIRAFDLFPNTPHVEVVSVFDRS